MDDKPSGVKPVKSVAIVGGGLGGMAAALALAEAGMAGLKITVFESSERLGGMAGASRKGDFFEDHGYHIFPPWYENLYHVFERLGIRGHLRDITCFHQLRRGEYPRFGRLENFTSFRYALKNLFSGAMPFWDLALYYYSVADLLCQKYSKRAYLDQISVTGFVRSRFYRTEAIARQYQDLLLKFISVPSYRVSAMTVQKMLHFWVANGIPMHRILAGDMHTAFIKPWEDRLRQLGCEIVTSQELTKIVVAGKRIVRLEFLDTVRNAQSSREVEDVILAMPPQRVVSLLDDSLYDADSRLFQMRRIETEAMASLSLYLDRKVDLPAEHINLLDSGFALTLIDVSQHWPGLDKTVLNIIASDVNDLEGVSDEHASAKIIAELKRYLPFLNSAAITRSIYQAHYKEPLVMNDVGVWQFRPKAATGLENLFLAGSHCRSHIDMTSMEGATVTGLNAANALANHHGLSPVWDVRQAKVIGRWFFLLLRLLGFPVALFGKLWVSLKGP
jgi:uncharacterized protein with NAD-binding domain and iron-sulfur cluster